MRGDFFYSLGASIGSLALTAMLVEPARLRPRRAATADPWPGRPLPAKAKACIFLMMEGGPSHIDTFDPKPRLASFTSRSSPGTTRPQSAMASGKRVLRPEPVPVSQGG